MNVYAESAVPGALAVFAVAISLVLFIAAVILCFVRAAHRDKVAGRAEASVNGETRPTVEGEDVVLFGTVRHLEDHDVAVKVSVTQDGNEAESSGSWSHSWIEIDRDIVVAPFLLELTSGELVRIAPPSNVDVADALDQKVWINRNKRVLSAELVPGEKIYARGRLERSDIAVPSAAYRDVAWGWGLAPSDGQMLLSSEPLGAGLRQRAAFHRTFGLVAVGLLVATQLTLVGFYGRALGSTVSASVSSKRYYTSKDSDGDTYHHHMIRLASDTYLDDPEIELHGGDYSNLGEGDTIPVRHSSATNWNLGSLPTIHWAHGVMLVITTAGFWISYKGRRRASRPWFRRKVNDQGSGRLPDSA